MPRPVPVPSPVPSLPASAPAASEAVLTITVEPWVDAVVDRLGFDPRSRYVERFWLSILGPTSTLLMRHLAAALDTHDDAGRDGPLELDAAHLALALGIGHRRGRNAPLVRAMARCTQFRLAQRPAPTVFVVRRRMPPLTLAQVARLPGPLRLAHERWQQRELDRRPPAASAPPEPPPDAA